MNQTDDGNKEKTPFICFILKHFPKFFKISCQNLFHFDTIVPKEMLIAFWHE